MTLPVYLVDDDDAVRKALILLLSTVGIKAKGFADPTVFRSIAGSRARLPDLRHPHAGHHRPETAGKTG